ncbi:MAG: PKD domain-containing protein [Caldilineaceae bacterium]
MHHRFKQLGIILVALVTLACAFWGSATTSQAADNLKALFQSPLPTVPNDNFGKAQNIGSLPFNINADITNATLQANEPIPYCGAGAAFGKTVWYKYTPTANTTLMMSINWGSTPILAVYTGSALRNLSIVQCSNYWNRVGFQAQAGVTYYIQIGDLYGSSGSVNFSLDVAPPPETNFYYYPNDPSIYDTITFNDYASDPAGFGIQSSTWDFGDGSGNSNTAYPLIHQYATDGDYAVTHRATTTDGRIGSTTQIIPVRTRDVYISKFARPKSVTAGQTKKLTVSVANTRYPQNVRVDLYKGMPSNYYTYYQIGYTEQFVAANQTTAYSFNYTFTDADAAIGKVTFMAIATILDGRDALPADNQFITLPITVAPSAGRSAIELDAADTNQVEVDEESNKAADGPIMTDTGAAAGTKKENGSAAYNIYMPLIEQ